MNEQLENFVRKMDVEVFVMTEAVRSKNPRFNVTARVGCRSWNGPVMPSSTPYPYPAIDPTALEVNRIFLEPFRDHADISVSIRRGISDVSGSHYVMLCHFEFNHKSTKTEAIARLDEILKTYGGVNGYAEAVFRDCVLRTTTKLQAHIDRGMAHQIAEKMADEAIYQAEHEYHFQNRIDQIIAERDRAQEAILLRLIREMRSDDGEKETEAFKVACKYAKHAIGAPSVQPFHIPLDVFLLPRRISDD